MDISKFEEKTDEEIAGLISKNKDVFAVIIRRYEKRLMAYMKRINGGTQENLEDIVQNIFIKVYVNINSYKKDKKFSSWLYGIAHNECIDYWRKNKKHDVGLSLDDCEDIRSALTSDEDLFDDASRRFDAEKTQLSLKKLPAKYREILILRFLEDKSYEEIGEILEKPVSTVGTLVRRAKELFKKNLS